MPEVIRFEEAEPQTLPTLTLTDEYGDSEQLDVNPHVWRRIEQYTAFRWSSRQAVWTVIGGGDWFPHLRPVTNVTVDVWDETLHVWEAVTVDATPLGYHLPSHRTYRITCDLGDTPEAVPQLIVEAYRRLEQYMTEAQLSTVPVGASSHSESIGGELSESLERNPAHVARALQNSGCADLLRPYRSV